jgi:hypothetical protein
VAAVVRIQAVQVAPVVVVLVVHRLLVLPVVTAQ